MTDAIVAIIGLAILNVVSAGLMVLQWRAYQAETDSAQHERAELINRLMCHNWQEYAALTANLAVAGKMDDAEAKTKTEYAEAEAQWTKDQESIGQVI